MLLANNKIEEELELIERDSSIRILLLEDNDADAFLLVRALKKMNVPFEHRLEFKKEGFVQALDKFKPDLIISDHSMPQFTSVDAVRILKESGLDIPFILVTGTITEQHVLSMLENGMDDYVLKNNLIRLPNVINNVLNKKHLEIKNKKIEILYRNINQAYKEIFDSVNYAKKIQEALLPGAGHLNQLVPDSFVLYRPLSIVSGDFYWCHEVNGTNVIVCGDCTGHGVPGALLSMLGMTFLDQIVKLQEVTDPAEILRKLDQCVVNSIGKEKGINDGMEVSICCHDKEKKLVHLGLAMHTALVVCNEEMIAVKGDKNSIGSGANAFSTHTFELDDALNIYLFSDGYADQFGGADLFPNSTYGKKFQMKRFRQVLLDKTHLPMKKQGEILESTLKDWMGDLHQIDDITVIGLRF